MLRLLMKVPPIFVLRFKLVIGKPCNPIPLEVDVPMNGGLSLHFP